MYNVDSAERATNVGIGIKGWGWVDPNPTGKSFLVYCCAYVCAVLGEVVLGEKAFAPCPFSLFVAGCLPSLYPASAGLLTYSHGILSLHVADYFAFRADKPLS